MKTFAVFLVLALSSMASAAPPEWCVRILCYHKGDYVVDAAGSGTFTEYGVLTNYHVVYDKEEKKSFARWVVVFPDHRAYECRIDKKDVTRDLALLVPRHRIAWPAVKPLKLSTVGIKKGDSVTIHGYGQFNYLSQTGKVINFYIQKDTDRQIYYEITPAKARPGDSGGAMVKDDRLVGVLFGSGPAEPTSEWGKPNCGYTMGTKLEEVHDFLGAPESPYVILGRIIRSIVPEIQTNPYVDGD